MHHSRFCSQNCQPTTVLSKALHPRVDVPTCKAALATSPDETNPAAGPGPLRICLPLSRTSLLAPDFYHENMFPPSSLIEIFARSAPKHRSTSMAKPIQPKR
mmetsp:Transcript_8192/g.16337  ORF Transcript_8192/g.16337 Transcript_8192/m.16337 type:complete len:102 (+) Transcript_8192:1229-1534(+)